MNVFVEEYVEYRHKKFDQNKRMRCESSSSSTEDDCAHIKIERINESPFQNSLPLSWSINNIKQETFTTPAVKRPRLNSYGNTPLQQPAAALTNAASAVIPPAAAILPKISNETLRSICKYHGNMVRKFPKKQRSPKDQERRNKNTIACRLSRRVKKLEHIAIEEQYKEFSQQTFNIIEQSMRATAYLHELMKLTTATTTFSLPSTKLETITLNTLTEKTSAAAQYKKPFTIAYLTGNM